MRRRHYIIQLISPKGISIGVFLKVKVRTYKVHRRRMYLLHSFYAEYCALIDRFDYEASYIYEKADEIREKVQQDRHISCVDIGMGLGIENKTGLNHLQNAGYKKKLDIWVPHEPSAKNIIDRINICDALLKRNEIELFLKCAITSDEK